MSIARNVTILLHFENSVYRLNFSRYNMNVVNIISVVVNEINYKLCLKLIEFTTTQTLCK